jgi:hypothetical protein
MTTATFLSQPPGLPLKTQSLNLPKHSTNSFCPLSLAFEMGHLAIFPQICQDQEKEQGISRLLQAATLGWPLHSPSQGTIRWGLWTHPLNLMYA